MNVPLWWLYLQMADRMDRVLQWWINGWMDESKVGRLSTLSWLLSNLHRCALVLDVLVVLVGVYGVCACVCVHSSKGTVCPCEFKPLCVCVCCSPVCAELSRVVCSAAVLGCTLTRCDRVEIPVQTAFSPTHNHTHTNTHPLLPPSSPAPTHRAHIPLAVYFRHSTSSARRQNPKPSMFSLPLHFTSSQKSFPRFRLLTGSITWGPSMHQWHGFKWDMLCNVPLCNATFSYVHPPCFLPDKFFPPTFVLSFFQYLPAGWLAPWTMNQGDSHSRGRVIWHLRLSQFEPWPLFLHSWWVQTDKTRRNLNTLLFPHLNMLMSKNKKTPSFNLQLQYLGKVDLSCNTLLHI